MKRIRMLARFSLRVILSPFLLIYAVLRIITRTIVRLPWAIARLIWRTVVGTFRAINRVALYVYRTIVRIKRTVGRVIAQATRNTINGIKATPGAIWRVPIRMYRRLAAVRTWIMDKAAYLEAESAKWQGLFKVIKSPYKILLSLGLSPSAATGLLLAGSVAGGGVVVNETVLASRSFSAGDPGVYAAPLDTPVFYEEKFNTLRLDLGTTSVGLVDISSISLGTAYTGSALPSGESNVIYIGGLPASSNPTFNQTWLEVGHLIIDRWRCERLDISHSEVHKLIVTSNVSDGQSISAVAGVPRDRGINGGNRADDMTTSGGYYDMLKITAASSGVNGKVDVLRLSNIYSKGGACTIKYVKAGTMEVTFNEIGGDESLATKALTIATSVIYKSFTNTSNVEVSMPVPATQ
jgi:hypothetical protein